MNIAKLFFVIAVALGFFSMASAQTQVAESPAVVATSVAMQAKLVQVDRPVKKVGDFCAYQVIDDWKGNITGKHTLTVLAVSDSGYDFKLLRETGAVEEIKATSDLGFLSWGETKYSPNNASYSFPLHVGKTWNVKYDYVVKSKDVRGSFSLTAKVVGEEEITTPAGKLTAVKTDYKGNYRSVIGERSGMGMVKMTSWYVPSVGCTARTRYEDTDWRGGTNNRITIELTAYKVE